jgi:CRISPR-associated protein Csd1
MILQALTAYYEDLVARNAIGRPGWADAKVSCALYLDAAGNITHVAMVKTEQQRGKKTVLIPQTMRVPAPVKRTVGVAANFLCDNSGYILGVDNKDNPKRTAECFAACKKLHETLLCGVHTPGATALLNFFEKWEPEHAKENAALSEYWEELITGGNLVFRFDGQYLQEDEAIAQAWQKYYLERESGIEMTCLITGDKGPVESVHPAIKGVQGAQSSGVALISFNAPAFCSYGKTQNYNAPTSKYAAFAYTAALNYLLADRDHVNRIGDTTVVAWVQGGEPAYQGMLAGALFGNQPQYSEADLLKKVRDLAEGKRVSFDETMLDPTRTFYILGISPNAARLSVRFFLKDSFGAFMKNLAEHYGRLDIVRPANDPFPTIPIWKLLSETVNQNSKDKTASPNLAGDVLRAVLTNTDYPATLLNGVVLRIRAEHEVTRGRAAIIKAYYMKRKHRDVPKEVLTVALNPESTSVPYQLGRLFSILEGIQMTANPGINSTIKDKYFNSASATPAVVFPVLINLAQKHLKKIGGGLQIILEKKLEAVMEKLGEEYPVRMNLQQQGAFQLGYYHQTVARYQGKNKEEKTNA